MAESIEAGHVRTVAFEDAWAAVQSGLHYVSWLAKDFLHTGVAREDLEAEGRLGLFQAALRFEPSHGVQFLTYASWWARRRMQTFVTRHAQVVRRPAPRYGHSHRRDDVSLDDLVSAGGALRWTDVLTDERAPRALEAIVGDEDRDLVARAAEDLPPLWRMILVRRFGLDGAPAMTLAAIGDQLSLSRERVRQIESKAMRRLRARLEEAWGREESGDQREPREMTTAAARSPLTLSVVRHMSRNLSTPRIMPIPSGGTPTMPRMSATTGSDPAGTPAVPIPPSTQMPTTTS